MLQLDLGYNPISILEVVSSLNINNISDAYLNYYAPHRLKKYNPKIYMSALNTIAQGWIVDSTTPSLSWPESFGEKYNSPNIIHQLKLIIVLK